MASVPLPTIMYALYISICDLRWQVSKNYCAHALRIIFEFIWQLYIYIYVQSDLQTQEVTDIPKYRVLVF